MTAIYTALANRFPAPEYALFNEVASRVGGPTRYADAIAMSLFPSRGLDIHGFEVKVDRRDWLREKKDPYKAEEIASYCDYWWIVINKPEVAQADELPDAWGLLVQHGNTLTTKKKAKKLAPKPLTRVFLAALLRRAEESLSRRLKSADGINEAYERGREEAKLKAQETVERSQGNLNALQGAITLFEEKSGLHISQWDAGDIGEAVRSLMNLERSLNFSRVLEVAKDLRRVSDGIVAQAEALRGFLEREAASPAAPEKEGM